MVALITFECRKHILLLDCHKGDLVNIPSTNLSGFLSSLADQLREIFDDKVISDCGNCEIPPPCGYPKEAGRITTQAATAGFVTLTLRIRNGGSGQQSFQVSSDTEVEIDPTTFSLGPMERRNVVAKLGGPPLPPTSSDEHVIWVKGAQTQYVLWDITTDDAGNPLPSAVDIVDRPDYQHHWYDHFYCLDNSRIPEGPDSLTGRLG